MNYKKKFLGQHFLYDQGLLTYIAESARINAGGLVIEVGPGEGTLTALLHKKTTRVISLEFDEDLIEPLQEKFGAEAIIHTDALRFTPPDEPYKLVGNIPYQITSPLLTHFLADQYINGGTLPASITFVMQKEVAEKIIAVPPHMNVLALHVQPFISSIKILKTIKPGSFSPPPKVTSSLIHMEMAAEPKIGREDFKNYLSLVHQAFSQKRKQLGNMIPKELLEAAGIDATRRPQTLSLEEWSKML